MPDAALERLRAAGRMQMLDPLSADLLDFIRDGAMNSTRIPLELAQILIDQNLVD